MTVHYGFDNLVFPYDDVYEAVEAAVVLKLVDSHSFVSLFRAEMVPDNVTINKHLGAMDVKISIRNGVYRGFEFRSLGNVQ